MVSNGNEARVQPHRPIQPWRSRPIVPPVVSLMLCQPWHKKNIRMYADRWTTHATPKRCQGRVQTYNGAYASFEKRDSISIRERFLLGRPSLFVDATKSLFLKTRDDEEQHNNVSHFTMERLFSPCTRLHDILESQGRLGIFEGRRQVLQELNLDVSTEELISTERAFTYAGLYAMLGNEDTQSLCG
jgi:hypothetical protein